MSRGVQRRAVITDVPVPPPDPRPYVPSITLPCDRESTYAALHDAVLGFPMHWVDDQHLPHVHEREWCPGCKLGQTPFWQGYVGVINLRTNNRFIMRIPAAAFRESGPFRERSDAKQLSCTVFTAFRFGSSHSKNRPAKIVLVDYPYPVTKPRAFPLLAALTRYWRMETADCVDQVGRPEDLEVKVATDFAAWAQRRQAEQRKGRGAHP